MSEHEHILVIKHGALGDMVLATAGFKAIRAAHPDAFIVCMTTKPYAELLAQSPYFNEIWVDSKPKWRQRDAVRRLRDMLNSKEWSFVYDLQTSGRTTLYQWLFQRPWPNISNVSRWSSHGYTEKERHSRHALDNLQRQLQLAGIEAEQPDVSWLGGDVFAIKPEGLFALLVPGGAPHRPDKRWPAEQYAALAQELVERRVTPLLLGTSAEREALDAIAARVPQAVNLGGRTSIAQIAELARSAAFAVGNDTGPMHVIAAAGCPSVVLFSGASDPARSAPVGQVSVLRRDPLADLSVDEVLASLTATA